ncbi:MAG: DNA-deoxyinosine glycosylase [Pseudomonadota bacterium]
MPTATHIVSFEAISTPTSRLLILGSIPGKASLKASQYYAHPRNLFWSMMEHIAAIPADLDYALRLNMLNDKDIALWDVLKSCHRTSSLDSDIDERSIIPNDFENFFSAHPLIRFIFFNGAKAETSFLKYVHPTLKLDVSLQYYRLPSTSPANASVPISQKVKAWSLITQFLK